jgi:hypothetical protein
LPTGEIMPMPVTTTRRLLMDLSSLLFRDGSAARHHRPQIAMRADLHTIRDRTLQIAETKTAP